jgi:PAS domain S-box-containing protein
MGEQTTTTAGPPVRHFLAARSPAPPRSSPRRLFLRFVAAAAVALAAALVLGLLLARWDVGSRARERAIGEADAVAARFGSDDLARTAFTPAARSDFFDDFFGPLFGSYDPAAVTLYDAAGRVTYASERTGRLARPPADPAIVRRAAAEPQYRVVGDVQSTLVPAAWALAPNVAHGILRIDRDYAPVAAQVRRDFLREAAAIALALAGLFAALLPIARAYVNRARTAAIVDYSNDAIIGQTPDNVITTWNAGAEHVYGWPAADVIGRPIDVLLPDERPEPLWDTLDDLTRTTHVHRDGRPVEVSVTVSPVRDAEGTFIGSSMIVRPVDTPDT